MRVPIPHPAAPNRRSGRNRNLPRKKAAAFRLFSIDKGRKYHWVVLIAGV